MKRPIAIGLAAMALGTAVPVTYAVSQSAAETPDPKLTAESTAADRAEIHDIFHGARSFGRWLEGAQVQRYVDAAHFFDYLEEVEAARQAAIAAAAQQSSGGGGGNSLDAIKQCESGGNYSAVSSSGTYRGAYQFDQQTWESVGGSGDPAAASPQEQDQRAQMLYAQRGSSPWACG